MAPIATLGASARALFRAIFSPDDTPVPRRSTRPQDAGAYVGIYDYTCGTYGLGVWNNVVYDFAGAGIEAYTVTPAFVFHNTAARDQGPAGRSTDPDFPVTDDIDGQPRPAGSRCDIGADERGP